MWLHKTRYILFVFMLLLCGLLEFLNSEGIFSSLLKCLVYEKFHLQNNGADFN